MKKIHFPILLATALCLTACSNDDDVSSNDDGKALISLGGVGQNNMTRAGFTGAETTLKIHYVSTRKDFDENTFPYNDGMKNETEAKGNLYMTSTATAAQDGTNKVESYSDVTQTPTQQRFWDDAHGRNSLIALYAIAVPNKTSITNTTNSSAFDGWDTNQKVGTESSVGHTIAWTVSSAQTKDAIADEDLAYSKNVSSGNTIGFDAGTKKFEKAEGEKSLVFNHALSRFTVNVKKGEGFGEISETEFKVTKAMFSGMTTAGTLDVSVGSMTPTTQNQNVDFVGTRSDYKNESNELIGYTFCAQVFPGVALKNVEKTMLTFVIDGNNYNIKGKEIYEVLAATASEAEKTERESIKAGKNYKLNITINKKGIEIMSAKLIDWEQITGSEQTPTNDITVYANMESSAGTQTTVASDIYRSSVADGKTGYASNKNTLAADNTLGTKWYWPDNNTKYHFRTISPQNTDVSAGESDYITMTGGAINNATNDYIWGAPLKEKHTGEETHKFTYKNGYADYLYDAIGVTDSKIYITQFHVMSNIEVNLSTSDDDSKVNLTDAKVELMGFYNTASLDLYDAKITTTGSVTGTQEITRTENGETASKHTYRVIPQAVETLRFKITAQGNIYYVDIKNVQFNGSPITNWLPGEAYVYKFKLTKKGIDVLSAKLVDWTTITGDITDVDLES